MRLPSALPSGLPSACALRPAARGFTLIEMMVTLVVVAVLAAIAVPSYQSSVRKARRADGMDAAMGVQQAQERFRSNNTSYATTLTAISQPATSTGGYYGVALSAVSAAGYTLTLTGVSGSTQASDTGCSTLTVAVTNGSPVTTPTACWSK